MHVYIVKYDENTGRIGLGQLLLELDRGTHMESALVEHYKVKQLDVDFDKPETVMIDGNEYNGIKTMSTKRSEHMVYF